MAVFKPARIPYVLEWRYADLEGEAQPPDPRRFDVHFSFLLRFPDVPPGPGHCAFYVFNVLSPQAAQQMGIAPSGGRGMLVMEAFSHGRCVAQVTQAVAQAFAQSADRAAALARLDTLYINTNLDFSAEFESDLLPPQTILTQIHEAFDGVARGDGVTLHQAIALDDYGDAAAQAEARARDTEARWQDVPDVDIARHPSYFTFLDDAGIRYYLPAQMAWALRRHDDEDATVDEGGPSAWYRLTPSALLPIVAPRNQGRGLGAAFDVPSRIARWRLSAPQVRAVYRFLCFAVVRQGLGEGVDEDELPAMRQWRDEARERQ